MGLILSLGVDVFNHFARLHTGRKKEGLMGD